MARVLIGADLCPIGANLPFFESGDARSLFNDLLEDLNAADLVIANLECPLVTQPSPIRKTGPVFSAAPAAINGLQSGGIDVLTLANNHIKDHGSAGVKSTIETCRKAGIATVGAGESLESARRILVSEAGGVRIGIMGVAEHEFSIVTKNSWGANPIDLIDFVRNVNSRRADFDYLIVLLHGGQEFHVPSPRLQETCRFMIEMGASAVIVQHPHCLGGYETYRGGHIVYGQGALVMDEALYRNLPTFHEGFLVELTVAPNAASSMEIIPFTQSAPQPGARKMPREREKAFRKMLAETASNVTNAGWVEKQWLNFCRRQSPNYISAAMGHNRVLSKLNSNGLLSKSLPGSARLLTLTNLIRCETHRETLETILAHGLF